MDRLIKHSILTWVVCFFLCLSYQNTFAAVDYSAIKLSKTIAKGEKFALPQTTVISLAGGKTKTVAIAWSKSTVTTTKVGKFIFNGTTKQYNRKVVFTLTVIMASVDFMPYKPMDWDAEAYFNKINRLNAIEAEFGVNDDVYLNCAFINKGNASSSKKPVISILLNDELVKNFTYNKAVKANEPIVIKNLKLGKFKRGFYNVKVIVNYNMSINEENVVNNSISLVLLIAGSKELSKEYYENQAANFKMKLPQGWYIRDATEYYPNKTTNPTINRYSLVDIDNSPDYIVTPDCWFNTIFIYTMPNPEDALDEKTIEMYLDLNFGSIMAPRVNCVENSRKKGKIGDNDAYIINFSYSSEGLLDGTEGKAVVLITKIGDIFYVGVGYSLDLQGKNDFYRLINESFESFEILEN